MLCLLQFFRELVAHDKGTVQGHLQDFLLGPNNFCWSVLEVYTGIHLEGLMKYRVDPWASKQSHLEMGSALGPEGLVN